jgi:TolA-binding protein
VSAPHKKYIEVDTSDARVERLWRKVRPALAEGKPQRLWWPRLLLATALLGAAAAVTLFVLRPQPASQVLAGAGFETATDSMLVDLVDGSRMELAANSRVEVQNSDATRVDLLLVRGRVECDVSHRPERTFSVHAQGVEVRVRGTRFGVALSADRDVVDVAVERGVVEVRLPGKLDPARTLTAGEHWTFDPKQPQKTAPAAEATQAEPVAPVPRASAERPRSHPAKATSEHAAPAPISSAQPAPEASAPPTLQTADPKQLLDMGSAARRNGDAQGAARAYQQLLSRYPGDSRAGLAAFELGRVRMDRLGDLPGAVRALRQAMQLAPSSGFREDALARLVQAYAGLGAKRECQQARDQYLSSYPEGVHAEAIKHRCGTP